MSEHNWNLFSLHTFDISILFWKSVHSLIGQNPRQSLSLQCNNKWQYVDLSWIRYKVDNFYKEQQALLTVFNMWQPSLNFLKFFPTQVSHYTDILSGFVKLLDEVCFSHTKQIGDNKTVCTTQEVRKMLLIGLSLNI